MSINVKAVATSPAKIILFGEHFVVSGNTAISMAVDLPTRVTVEHTSGRNLTVRSADLGLQATFAGDTGDLVDEQGENAASVLRPILDTVRFTLAKHGALEKGLTITVMSKAPVGMGLGSSAATAVATVSAISAYMCKHISRQEIFEAAYSLERIVHGQPSGVDQATVTFGGLIKFRKGNVKSHLVTIGPPNIIIGNTKRRRSTSHLISTVTKLRRDYPKRYEIIALAAEKLADRAIGALIAGNTRELGNLMNSNQELLESVGVSSPELQKLISAARSAGALGAKLTGGGGGGCMIALAEQSPESVAKSIQDAGGEVLPGIFMPEGVQSHIEDT